MSRLTFIRAGGIALLLGALSACGAVRWENENAADDESQNTSGRPSVSSGRPVSPSLTSSNTRPASVSSLLNDYYLDWRGTPYQFGGTTRHGIDCSALTQQAMSALGIPLKRTTKQQFAQGVAVEAVMTRPGDLVFFKTSEVLNHVGVIVGPAKFMHASTKNGVTISRLDDPYWSSRVIGYRRVIQ